MEHQDQFVVSLSPLISNGLLDTVGVPSLVQADSNLCLHLYMAFLLLMSMLKFHFCEGNSHIELLYPNDLILT